MKLANSLVNPNNGEEALEYLRDESNKKPCVILLDSNMPKTNGIEFLKIVKTDDFLKKIPVAALSTSKKDSHIYESFKLGVSGYIVKPLAYKKFVDAIRAIDRNRTLSELPDRS